MDANLLCKTVFARYDAKARVLLLLREKYVVRGSLIRAYFVADRACLIRSKLVSLQLATRPEFRHPLTKEGGKGELLVKSDSCLGRAFSRLSFRE